MAVLVSPPDWNISITYIWISIKVCIDIHNHQRINPGDFSDPLDLSSSFHMTSSGWIRTYFPDFPDILTTIRQIVAPSPGQHFYLLIILLHDKILANKQTLTCSIPVIYDVSVLDLHQGKWVIVGQKDIST